jgi:hypothetical protein
VRQNLSYTIEPAPTEEQESTSQLGTDKESADGFVPTPASWAHSSVSTFGVRYINPPSLSPAQSVEALVEGSRMSLLREGKCL